MNRATPSAEECEAAHPHLGVELFNEASTSFPSSSRDALPLAASNPTWATSVEDKERRVESHEEWVAEKALAMNEIVGGCELFIFLFNYLYFFFSLLI